LKAERIEHLEQPILHAPVDAPTYAVFVPHAARCSANPTQLPTNKKLWCRLEIQLAKPFSVSPQQECSGMWLPAKCCWDPWLAMPWA
jgi:hypothetical protein